MSFTTTSFFFFFNDTATTEIYTLSLHDALPILLVVSHLFGDFILQTEFQATNKHGGLGRDPVKRDRKSTRLNSSHANISYAVFCLKKKKNNTIKKLLIIL